MKNKTWLEEQEVLYSQKHNEILMKLWWDTFRIPKEYFGEDELYILGFNSAQKEFKKEIKDKYNHYNSKLKEATKTKLDRRDRTEYIIKLEAKVELLKQMLND